MSSEISFSHSTRAMGHPQHINVINDYVFLFASQTQVSLQQFHVVHKFPKSAFFLLLIESNNVFFFK